MGYLGHEFYIQPLSMVIFEAVAAFVIWTAFITFFSEKTRRIISIAAASCALVLILMFTVMRRTESCYGEMILTPFQTLEAAKSQVELYRTLLMNIVLFMPLGMSLPFALPSGMRYRFAAALALCVVLSILIELAQFIFCLGRCETDDVIMNTLGAFFGALSYPICIRLREMFSPLRRDNNKR